MEKTGILLTLRLDDLERPVDRQTVLARDEEHFHLDMHVELVPLGRERFGVPGPTSLTPFGPYGPMFHLGDVIQAVPAEDGWHRFVRRLESSDVWGRCLPVPHLARLTRPAPAERERGSRFGSQRALRAVLSGGRIGELFEKLERAGGGWEYCVGNVTIQLPVPRGSELPPDLQDLVDELFDLLLPLDAKKRGAVLDRS
jgi:hypothetical protein